MSTSLSKEYSYKYVRLPIRGGGWSGRFSQEYQDAIDDHAREGWRFVQAFAPPIMAYGAAKFTDLIFEKRVT